MTAKAYIYSEDGALLGYIAYAETPPDVLELSGRFFEKKGTSREMEALEDAEILTYDYWEIDVEQHHDVIYICTAGCGRNASITWWKCCPEHCSLEGPDVVCQSCVERLHPGDPEFSRG